MHVHVGEIEEDWFPLYLANGLTGLREMAASEKNAPRQRQYEQDVVNGRRIGPELFWTLFPMDAPAINDEGQARAEVARRAIGLPEGVVSRGDRRSDGWSGCRHRPRFLAVYKDLVRRMDQRGVRILAGTDTPYAYCVPGFALHEELALLPEAGLSPAAALRTATWNPAEFL